VLIAEHSEETTVSPEVIWRVWEDVHHWPRWDHGIELSSLDGPFEAGVTGTMKPKDGPLLRTRLTSVEPLKGFILTARLPLCNIVMIHRLSVAEGTTTATSRVEMRGLLAPLFAHHIGKSIRQKLPQEMRAMVQYAISAQ
jgi:hypothetical protein